MRATWTQEGCGAMIEGECHCGAVRWYLAHLPESATSCNCTLCRRWGALWAYGFKDQEIRMSGATRPYLRDAKSIEFHFCTTCGCVAYWRTHEPGSDGRHYMAVNLRLTEPDRIAEVPIVRFDGLGSFEALPADDTCVADLWF